MATTCPGCASVAPETAPVCAACGWDFAAGKRSAQPAGLDLFFPPGPKPPEPPPKPKAPSPPPFEDAAPPAPAAPPPPEDPFAAITRAAEAKGAGAFSSKAVDSLLEALRRSQPGREALTYPQVQAAASKLREPKVFYGAAGGLAFLALAGLYALWPAAAPPPPPPSAPAAPEAYVRPAASFAATPRAFVVHELPAAATAPAAVPAAR